MSAKPRRNIPISRPFTGDEEWQALREPLETGWLTQGPRVAAFEKAFAARHEVPRAVATTSCTTALHLALVALGVGPGDEVIVPAFTWVATANVVLHCGATPVFADVERDTFNLDPEDLARRITTQTRAVIPVHLFGLCADMDTIRGSLPEGVVVLEDAACAIGARYRGRSAGSLGEAAAFSFHPRKVITTGEGGMLTTGDPELAERAVRLRNHGASVPEEERHHGPKPWILPEFSIAGFNYRMTDLQGAVGLVQLSRLGALLEERQKWASFYERELADLGWLRTPRVPEGDQHGWQAYVVYLDPDSAPMPRDEIMERMDSLGIATRPGTHAVHTLELYRSRLGLAPSDFPAALDCHRNAMAIPLHNRMTADDYAYVVESLHRVANEI